MNQLRLMIAGMGTSILAHSCAPSTDFQSSSDISKQIRTRSTGFEDSPNRVELDCFVDAVNGNNTNRGQRPTAMGIPVNCANTVSGTAAQMNEKYDVAVVLDVSENMATFSSDAKESLIAQLKALNAENRIATLSAVSFRDNIVAKIPPSDVTSTLDKISGKNKDWNPNDLSVVNSNSTDWIKSDYKKSVFAALQEAIRLLQTTSNKIKIVHLINASINSNISGFTTASTSENLSKLATQLAADSGRFILSYAANPSLMQGASTFDPTPLRQLDRLASMAGISPLRKSLPSAPEGWSESVIKRASTGSETIEACRLISVQATGSKGEQIFQKEVAASGANGSFEFSIPESVPNGVMKLKVSRKCEKSGVKVQNITFTLSAGGIKQ